MTGEFVNVARVQQRRGVRVGTITLTWSQVLVIALAAIGLYVVELLSFVRATRRQAELEKRTQDRLNAMAVELAATEEKIEKLVVSLRDARPARQEATPVQPEIQGSPHVQDSYGQAVQLAGRGLDAAAVAAQCGISRTEADLIVALSRSRAA